MSDENIITHDCEYVKSVVDEYLHDELSEADKKAVDGHILECDECREFYAEEKSLTDIIKSSEDIDIDMPEISFSERVMEKIITERITIEKPPRKRRPIPFGLISAAVVVLMIFITNPNMFGMPNDNTANSSDKSAQDVQEMRIFDVAGDSAISPYYDSDYDEGYGGDENGDAGEIREIGESMADAEEAAENIEQEAAVAAPALFSLDLPEAEAPAEAAVAEAYMEMDNSADIPVPTGPFSEHPVVVIICANVDGDVRERITAELLEEIKTAETDKEDANIIYMPKDYQDAVINILDKNSVPYEYRQGDANAKDIAVFFY